MCASTPSVPKVTPAPVAPAPVKTPSTQAVSDDAKTKARALGLGQTNSTGALGLLTPAATTSKSLLGG